MAEQPPEQTVKRTDPFADLDLMPFGIALEALKDGHIIAREGWNGKGMFLWLNRGACDLSALNAQAPEDCEVDTVEGVPSRLFVQASEAVTRLPNINMHSASGSAVIGWLASQTDMLAEDWRVIGEVPSNG